MSLALSPMSDKEKERDMQGIQVLLPARVQAYAKAIVALVLAVATSLSGVLGAPDWLTVAVAVLTPVAVFLQANAPLTSEDERDLEAPH